MNMYVHQKNAVLDCSGNALAVTSLSLLAMPDPFSPTVHGAGMAWGLSLLVSSITFGDSILWGG